MGKTIMINKDILAMEKHLGQLKCANAQNFYVQN